jgi:hypothetical protein
MTARTPQQQRIELHNAVVEKMIPPPPDPEKNPGQLLTALLAYKTSKEGDGNEVTAEELVQVMAHLIDYGQWEATALQMLELLRMRTSDILVPR